MSISDEGLGSVDAPAIVGVSQEVFKTENMRKIDVPKDRRAVATAMRPSSFMARLKGVTPSKSSTSMRAPKEHRHCTSS